jgi:hypothetical protein
MFFLAPRKPRKKQTRLDPAARGIHRPRASFFRPALELLEQRVVLSTVQWINSSSGYWDIASNWSTGQVPGSADNVVINQAGVTITFLTGTDSINSINSQDPIVVSGGSLSVVSASSLSSLTASGGKLSVAGATTIGALTLNGGTLTGAGNVRLSPSCSRSVEIGGRG